MRKKAYPEVGEEVTGVLYKEESVADKHMGKSLEHLKDLRKYRLVQRAGTVVWILTKEKISVAKYFIICHNS